jgi:hypothetical protein
MHPVALRGDRVLFVTMRYIIEFEDGYSYVLSTDGQLTIRELWIRVVGIRQVCRISEWHENGQIIPIPKPEEESRRSG